MRFILISIVTLVFISCDKPVKVKFSINDRYGNLKQDSFQLAKVGEKVFFLDSSCVPTSESIFYYENKGIDYLTLFNKPSKSIYFFNDSGKIVSKIQLQKEGPNGVGKAIGHYVYNMDSIFILDQWNKKIALINGDGKVINRFSFPNKTDEKLYQPSPYLSSVNPWVYVHGKIFASGCTLGEMEDENATNRPVVISYDLNSRTPNYFFSYPDIYQDANWGGSSYRSVYSTFDDSSNLIVSFPADHYVYKINLVNKQVQKYYGGSRYVDSIPSLSKQKDFYDKWFMNVYFGRNPSYSSIIYDKFQKVYYRIVDHSIKDYNEDIKEKSVKPFSIVVLNSKMERLGETLLPQLSHSRIAFYISKEGLNLRKYDENEDRLIFSVFRPEPVGKNLVKK